MNRVLISDRYEYTNEESISDRLKCMICSNPFIDPVKTKCKPREHTFCQHCITQWLQRCPSCPSCRQNLKTEELTPITEGILLDMLSELSVQCSICKKTGLERGNYDEHLRKRCVKQTVSCSSADVKCPWTGSQKQLEEHLKSCSYTALRPMLIQMITEKRQLEEKINQQQIFIDKLQQEDRQSKEQLSPQRRPLPNLPTGNRSCQEQRRSRENTAKSSIRQNEQSSSPKMSCGNCADCWRGAVRGSYFRGVAGGGLKHGTTLVSCDCDCHQ